MPSETSATHAALLQHHRLHVWDTRALMVHVPNQLSLHESEGAARTELLQLSEQRQAFTSVVDLATRARLATAGWQGVKGANLVRLAPKPPRRRAVPPYCSQNVLSDHRIRFAGMNRYMPSRRRRSSIADSCGAVLLLLVLHAAAAATIVASTGRRQSRSRVASPPWSSRTR